MLLCSQILIILYTFKRNRKVPIMLESILMIKFKTSTKKEFTMCSFKSTKCPMECATAEYQV